MTSHTPTQTQPHVMRARRHGANDHLATKVGITAVAMFAHVQRLLKFARRESASERFERHMAEAKQVMEAVQDIGIADDDERDGLLANFRECVRDCTGYCVAKFGELVGWLVG